MPATTQHVKTSTTRTHGDDDAEDGDGDDDDDDGDIRKGLGMQNKGSRKVCMEVLPSSSNNKAGEKPITPTSIDEYDDDDDNDDDADDDDADDDDDDGMYAYTYVHIYISTYIAKHAHI